MSAKKIQLRVLPAKLAGDFIKKHHYSGKVCQNSQLHFGVFYEGLLHGVMQFGPSLDKSKIKGLVEGTGWNEFIELNRMAFDDVLPRNSESRAIAMAVRLIRKKAPHIKWIISFADACQCGDGTIYRASGFVLTGFSSGSIFANKDRTIQVQMVSITGRMSYARKEALELQRKHGGSLVDTYLKHKKLEKLEGFSLRYIYFVDPACKQRLTVPIIPFSKIREIGATMYKGQRPVSGMVSRSANQPGIGGSNPTTGLSKTEPTRAGSIEQPASLAS